MRISSNEVRKDYRAGTLLRGTFACSFFFASVVTLAVTPTESQFGAALSSKPDALLQIDLNRSSVIEKIVDSWKGEIPAAQIDRLGANCRRCVRTNCSPRMCQVRLMRY
jgi:hypothetical protein